MSNVLHEHSYSNLVHATLEEQFDIHFTQFRTEACVKAKKRNYKLSWQTN